MNYKTILRHPILCWQAWDYREFWGILIIFLPFIIYEWFVKKTHRWRYMRNLKNMQIVEEERIYAKYRLKELGVK